MELRAYNKMRNGRVARDLVLLQGARRENILYGSSTDEQRGSSGKDRATRRAVFWRAPCQTPARKQRARSSFCYRLLVTERSSPSPLPSPFGEKGKTVPALGQVGRA